MSSPSPAPFADALDAAIEESGLSLDRIQHHLAERGVTVSRSALSYWRRGRSQPERDSSLRAVIHLEDVLGLSRGALTSRLGPRAPRGRWLGGPPDCLQRRMLWPNLRPLTADLKPPPDGQVTVWSVHERLVVDDESRERLWHVHQVAEAARDCVDRLMVYHQASGPTVGEPRYQGVRCGRIGRTATDPTTGMTAAEVLLDRPLALGEVVVVEYELVLPPGEPSTEYGRRFTRPVGEYVCQVQFGQRRPKRVSSFERRGLSSPRRLGRTLRLDAGHVATFATRDVGPGIRGVCWSW